MTDLMADVPKHCLTEGCTKTFGHDLDPDDPCEGIVVTPNPDGTCKVVIRRGLLLSTYPRMVMTRGPDGIILTATPLPFTLPKES